MTKLELQQHINRLTAENADLRTQNSELRATLDTLRARSTHTEITSRRAAMDAARAQAQRSGKTVLA